MGATISFGDHRHPVDPDGVVTFGRDSTSTICLDPDDRGISRVAGAVQRFADEWWIDNLSEKRTIHLVDEHGIRTALAPGRRHVVDQSETRIVVTGATFTHELVLRVDDLRPLARTIVAPESAATTLSGDEVNISDRDLEVLVALCAGYLRPFPRHDPKPRSYAEAAQELGCERSTVQRRIEHLRERLTAAGVPDLVGPRALDALAEFVLTTGIVTADHLSLLDDR